MGGEGQMNTRSGMCVKETNNSAEVARESVVHVHCLSASVVKSLGTCEAPAPFDPCRVTMGTGHPIGER